MTLSDIQREIAALPNLEVERDASAAVAATASPLQIVSKQGRLILRLSASVTAMEAYCRELGERLGAHSARMGDLAEEKRAAEARARQIALEAIRVMDALDWVGEALAARPEGGDPLAGEVASARRDCLRRLAAVGITEVPCQGAMDGRLHEGLETTPGPLAGKARYDIVSVLRRGYQCGADVLRRAGVVTVE